MILNQSGKFSFGIRMMSALSLILFLITGCAESGYYVSPTGSDENPGTRSEPFLTIQRAQEVVRDELAREISGDITIWLGDGTYFLSSPLRFDANDSGKGKNIVSYKALKGADPLISGGMEVSGWQHRGNGIWVAEVAHQLAEPGFRELFVDGERATRARYTGLSF